MKYLIRFIMSMLIMSVMMACSGDDGISSEKRRKAIIYTDMHIYRGDKDAGAWKIEMDTAGRDIDSLYHSLVRFKYFTEYSSEFVNSNNIRFEFVGDNQDLLAFSSESKTIVSTYEFRGDSLYIHQNRNPEDTVFVAVREGDSFYRTYSAQRYIRYIEGEDGKEIEKDSIDVLVRGGKTLNLETALQFAGIKDKESMTNKRDTVMFCNIKYIYQ